ncbi:MAG: DUF2062 domain-containing protein [Dissulfuribacterales bacterium]
MRLARTIRYYWLLMKRLSGDPGVIARGIALGTFIGFTPTLPFHTVATLFFAPLLRANPLAGVGAGILVCNPLTIPAIYYLSWKIGILVTGNTISWTDVQGLLEMVRHADFMEASRRFVAMGWSFCISMITGGLVMAIPAGIAAYFLSLWIYGFRRRTVKHDK